MARRKQPLPSGSWCRPNTAFQRTTNQTMWSMRKANGVSKSSPKSSRKKDSLRPNQVNEIQETPAVDLSTHSLSRDNSGKSFNCGTTSSFPSSNNAFAVGPAPINYDGHGQTPLSDTTAVDIVDPHHLDNMPPFSIMGDPLVEDPFLYDDTIMQLDQPGAQLGDQPTPTPAMPWDPSLSVNYNGGFQNSNVIHGSMDQIDLLSYTTGDSSTQIVPGGQDLSAFSVFGGDNPIGMDNSAANHPDLWTWDDFFAGPGFSNSHFDFGL